MPGDPPHHTAPQRRLADDLRAAIDGGEIELRFQPQVAMANGRIVGVEVLARWGHPQLGELGAERLFAAAARAALLPALSAHIHIAALAQITAWPASLAALTVAINVTASDLARPGFAPALLATLDARQVAPSRLTVEVTEHEPIGDLAGAAAVLAQLRAAGVAVALDDYGSGFSGEAWFRALPLDYLKLDGGLSQAILGTPAEVSAVIAMAREAGLGVIAEGVETAAQRAALAAAGATHYQGFLCAGPLDGAALARLVKEGGC